MSRWAAKYAFWCAVFSFVLMAAGSARAQEHSFNIPAENANRAITEFAREAVVQIVAPADQLKGVQTPAINGLMDTRQALGILLAGTGLEVASDDGSLITLRQGDAMSQPGVQPAGLPVPSVSSGPESVIVTGTLISGAAFAAPTPVTTVSVDEIQQQAPGSVFDFIKHYPQFNMNSGPTANSSVAQNASKADLNLYSLGAQRTLTLIDGQRHVPDSQTNVFDTNLIPVSLIQRMDVVTGGASAAYGSDAVAGVVNFILVKELEGFKSDWHVGISQYGDNVEFSPSLAWGTSMFHGRGHFIIGADVTIDEGTGNMFSRSWGRLQPGVFTTPAGRPGGVPSQLAVNDVSTSAYNASGLITSGPLKGIAFGENGSTYKFQYGSIVGSTEMQGGNDYGSVINPDEDIVPAYDRGAALARFQYDMDDDPGALAKSAFIQFQYGHLNTFGDSFGAQVPNFNNYPVLIANPFLPASIVAEMKADHIASFTYSATRDYDLGSIASRNRTDSMQGNIGVNGTISNEWIGNWDWDANLGIGAATFQPDIFNTPVAADFFESAYVVAGPRGVPECGPVATNPYFNAQNPIEKQLLLSTLQPNCVPYNIFGTNAAQNQGALNYFKSASEEDNEFRQYTFTLGFTGKPFSLPAGDISVAFGYDWRRDAINTTICAECMLDALMNQNYSSFYGQILVNEFYVEADVPILKNISVGGIPIAETFGINAAARNTNYSTSGDVTTWKLGFTWDVNDSLRIRGTRSFDIRAPNLGELFNPGSQGNVNVVNQINGTSGYIKTNTVGNPSLQPEEGNTWTGGIVLQPAWDWAQGFTASIDYYHINISKVIATLPVQTELNDYFTFGANSIYTKFVTPSAATSVEVSNVNSPELNLNNEMTDGFNFEVNYAFPFIPDYLGTLKFRAVGNWIDQFQTATLNGEQNTVDTISSPRTSWFFTFAHDLHDFETSLMIRYTSPTLYNNLLVGLDGLTPGTAQFNAVAASPNSINQNVWPDAIYFDTAFAYDILGREDKNGRLQVYLNITNILNKQPPIIAMSLNGSPYDLVGRDFKLGARFSF
jgi:iron complex outermembrane receptor protein